MFEVAVLSDGILTRFILSQNTTFAKLALFSFNIDSATGFGPKFGNGVVDCSPAGGIVRDDKAIASINADLKIGAPARIATRVNQELFVFPGGESITKPARVRQIRLSLKHGGNGLWFQYSTAGGFIT